MPKTESERVAEHDKRLVESGGIITRIRLYKQQVKDLAKFMKKRKIMNRAEAIRTLITESKDS